MSETKKRLPCPVCGSNDPGEDPCCNPKCNGMWGTNCYHCHYPPFLTHVDPEDIPELVERVKKYASSVDVDEVRRKERERCADLCDEEAEKIGSGPIMAFRACAKRIREMADGYIPRPRKKTGDRRRAPDPTDWIEVVDRILADFTDRRGLRLAWESIDIDIRDEIKSAWVDIVCRGMQRARELEKKQVLRSLYGRFGYDEIAVPSEELTEQTIWELALDTAEEARAKERGRVLKELQRIFENTLMSQDGKTALSLTIQHIREMPSEWPAGSEAEERRAEREAAMTAWTVRQMRRSSLKKSAEAVKEMVDALTEAVSSLDTMPDVLADRITARLADHFKELVRDSGEPEEDDSSV
jgi:hypothetical protein